MSTDSSQARLSKHVCTHAYIYTPHSAASLSSRVFAHAVTSLTPMHGAFPSIYEREREIEKEISAPQKHGR